MRKYVGRVKDLSEHNLRHLTLKAHLLGDAITDIAGYARARMRGIRRASSATSEPLEAIVGQVILDATRRMLDIKSDIVDREWTERRLVGAIDRETAAARHWAQEAVDAAGRGAPGLVQECRERERSHFQQTEAHRSQLEEVRAEIVNLKRDMQVLYGAVEDATRRKERVRAHGTGRPGERTIEQEIERVDQAIRLFEALHAP